MTSYCATREGVASLAMETQKQYDYLFKLLAVGQRGAGTSSVIVRMGRDEFSPIHVTTIGVDFLIKTIDIDGKKVKIQIWDSSGGRERFRTITSSYYRGSMGIMLVYDTTREDSFKELVEQYIPNMEMHAPPNSVKMILGNKCDLTESRAVTTERGKELADKHGYKFMEVSAKTGQNMDQALMEIAKDIKFAVDSELLPHRMPRTNAVPQQDVSKKGMGGKCF